jgi:hypothetical protein
LAPSADPGRFLTIEETTHKLREHGIGSYEAPGLWIGIGVRQVRVEPVARDVLDEDRHRADRFDQDSFEAALKGLLA